MHDGTAEKDIDLWTMCRAYEYTYFGVEMLVLGLRQGLQKPNKNLGGRHAPLTEIFLEHRFLAVESDMKGECFLPQRMKKLSH